MILKKIIFVQAIIIVILVWLVAIVGSDEFHKDEEEIEIEITNSRIEGNKIWLDEGTIKSSGITVNSPQAKIYTKEKIFPGIITPINDLIEANKKIKILKYKENNSAVRLLQKKQDLERIKGLYNSGKKASQRQLEIAQLNYENEVRLGKEFKEKISALKLEIQANWTKQIAENLDQNNELTESIIQKKTDVIRFSTYDEFNVENMKWYVNPISNKIKKKYIANLLGPSGITKVGDVGKTWLLHSPSLGVSSNSPVFVISETKEKLSGVEINDSSIVRFAGKSWIYIQRDINQFERIALNTDLTTESGVFSTSIKPTDKIIFVGAQTILSEELKHLITNENED